MTAPRDRRLLKELRDIEHDHDSGIFVELPDEANVRHMHGYINGPPDTPYVGGMFKIDIQIPEEYPFQPPKMTFSTKIWHPNVSSASGLICIDTLGKGWSPVQTIKTALISLRAMMESPEPKDPQDGEVGKQMINDPEGWARTAHEWSKKYAGAPEADIDFSKYHQEPVPIDPKVWEGYSPDLIAKFTVFGFQVEDVVQVLKELKIPTCGGEFFQPSETLIDIVCEKILGE